MQGYKYQSEFARKHYGQGHDEGLLEGREEGRTNLQRAALSLATAKLGEHAPELAAQIAEIHDLEQLGQLIVALGNAATSDEARAALARFVSPPRA